MLSALGGPWRKVGVDGCAWSESEWSKLVSADQRERQIDLTIAPTKDRIDCFL